MSQGLSQTFRGRAVVEAAVTATIYNVSALTAGTEYSQALSSGTKSFTIRSRGNSELKLAFTSGESGTKFVTIPKGASYSQEGLNFSGTLYFQANKNSETIEIVEWS